MSLIISLFCRSRFVHACGAVLLVLCALVMSTRDTAAQTVTTATLAGQVETIQHNVFGIGLTASLGTGMGVSVREHLAELPLGFQVSGGVWKTASISVFDVGVEVQYDLVLGSDRLYAVAGGGFYYYGNNSNELHAPTRFGAGIGYEWPLTPQIGVSGNVMMTVFEPSGEILPLPSIGGHFYFK